MNIERLTIEDFKQFTKMIVLDDLTPGLNVFTGMNEAGKSTIAEAVRTLFLQRYSNKLEGIAPWSKPTATPSIEAVFSVEGETFTLGKQFLNKSRCYLRAGTNSLDGDEAEQELANLFGFTAGRGSRGAYKAEQAGIPGLLWVQQGDSLRIAERATPAAEYLRSALGSLSGGEVVGGEDQLIKTVNVALNEVRTTNTKGAKGGKLPKLERELDQLKADLVNLELERAAFEEDLNTLFNLQRIHDEDGKNKPWESLEARANEARAKIAAVFAARAKRDRLQQDVKYNELTLLTLTERARAAEASKATFAATKLSLEKTEILANDVEATYVTAADAVTEVKNAYSLAVEAEALANAAQTAVEACGRLQMLSDEAKRLRAAIENAEKAQARLAELIEQRAKLEIDAKNINKLKRVGDALIQLRAQFEAASTRLEYRLNSAVELDGTALNGIGQVIVDTAKTLKLADQSELTIVPAGVADRQQLVDSITKQENEQTRLLQTMGVDSLDAAEARLKQWSLLNTQVSAQQAIVAVHAPAGIDTLNGSLVEVRGKEEATQARLNVLPVATDALPVKKATAEKTRTAALLEAANSEHNAVTEKRSIVRAEVERLRATVKAQAAEVESLEFVQALEKLNNEVYLQGVTVRQLSVSLGEAENELQALMLVNPEKEVETLLESARQAEKKYHGRDRLIVELRARIQTAGGNGVNVRLSLCKAHIELLEARHKELSDEEQALTLLHNLLLEERKDAIQQLQSPLTTRLQHYLKWLFPHSGLALGDDLEPVSLTRSNRLDELGALSYGTQEQLGILTRLAYADLLQQAGRPTVLFFDDAAVHTDSGRRGAIKQALLDAAQRHQIFLFTCHPELWNDLGVEQRALEELKAAA